MECSKAASLIDKTRPRGRAETRAVVIVAPSDGTSPSVRDVATGKEQQFEDIGIGRELPEKKIGQDSRVMAFDSLSSPGDGRTRPS
jgi:hypothetical protein